MITTLLCEWFSGPSVMPHWTTDDLQTVLPKPRVVRSCIQQGESLLKKIVNCVYVFSKVVITCANCCCCFLIFWNVRKAWNKTITKKQTFKSCFFPPPPHHPPLLHPFHPPLPPTPLLCQKTSNFGVDVSCKLHWVPDRLNYQVCFSTEQIFPMRHREVWRL